jgi:hypothetical protein
MNAAKLATGAIRECVSAHDTGNAIENPITTATLTIARA